MGRPRRGCRLNLPVDLPPIPLLPEPPNWSRLPICENGEPLVQLPAENHDGKLHARSLYAEQQIPGAPSSVSVRSGTNNHLKAAAASLPVHIALFVFDGYRPLIVQEYLYESFAREIALLRPDLTGESLHAYVRHFVAAPNADPACPPPHRTGGAVDVYLVDTRTGEPLPMGTPPDAAVPESATRWFEENPHEPFRHNRRLLFHALTGAGFTNYRGEWWHYEWGNQRWANCSRAECAMYGIALED